MSLIVIIVGILFILCAWICLDFTVGKWREHNRVNRQIDQHENQHSNDQSHTNFVRFDFQNAPIRHSQIELFTDGQVLFADFFNELENAKKHIHVLFYIAKNDSFSKEFFDILIKKAKQGVEVRLLLDWVGGIKTDRQKIKDLKAAGGQFYFCHVPKFPFIIYSLQSRNHRKLTVIDGEVAYLGGYNVGKEYLNQDEKLSPWRDYHLKLHGEGVHDIQREILRDWRKCAKIDLQQNEIYFPTASKGPVEHKIVPSEGAILEKTFFNLVNSAQTSIMIGSPYFIPSKKIVEALTAARKRGVVVKIIVPMKADHILVKEASNSYFRKLIPEGVEVYEFMNGFYHAKILMIDDTICDIGTANFDKRSFFLNHEINCYIFNKQFIEQAKKILQQDLQQSKRLTLAELNKHNLWRSTKEKIAAIFSNVL